MRGDRSNECLGIFCAESVKPVATAICSMLLLLLCTLQVLSGSFNIKSLMLSCVTCLLFIHVPYNRIVRAVIWRLCSFLLDLSAQLSGLPIKGNIYEIRDDTDITALHTIYIAKSLINNPCTLFLNSQP